MQAPLFIAAIAGLLVVISLIQPLARRLKVAPSVLLALVGTAIGVLSGWLLYTPSTDAFNQIASVFVNLPLNSQGILHLFLPVLLFQTTLTLDVRRMADDAGVIFVMAVVAVVVATAFIGFALAPFTTVPLVACLLLGAIVATTDPVAVVAIFRDIGAPARLGRLVEGESLLNDAAAIALFVILLGAMTGGSAPTLADGVELFLWSFSGGMALGYIGGQVLVRLLPLVRDFRLAQVTLSVAMPYLVYIIAENFIGVSGVVAVVVAGIVINLAGPSRVTPDGWTYLNDVWDQIAFWASSLIFMLASILIPKLLVDVGWYDIALLAIVVAAALAARAVVLFGLLPLMSLLQLSQPVSTPFKTVMLWGGMRGAITLTLALGVTENLAIDPQIKRFVAVLATGFVLFTLLVYGTTLKPLIKVFGLDKLPPLDAAMRAQVLALALANVREGVARAISEYHIAPAAAEETDRRYRERLIEAQGLDGGMDEILDRDRVTVGLVSISNREREIVLRHLRERTASIHTAEELLARIGRIADRARAGGRIEYNRAARQALAFPRTMRLAQWLQRNVKYDRWLARLLGDRYEMLLLNRIVLDELIAFTNEKIEPLLGRRVVEILTEILLGRREATTTALEALRLQYPDYADSLDQRFLQKAALRLEEDAYRSLYAQNLIGTELYSNLSQGVNENRETADSRPKLDMGMRTEELTAQLPLFRDLSEDRIRAISRLMRPLFAVPGELLIRKGERGDTAYFISSGAVEVITEHVRVRLGRGDVFGEIALLTGQPRTADVRALGYCNLLVLSRTDFRSLTDKDPTLKQHMANMAAQRRQMNATAVEDDALASEEAAENLVKES
ncbi:cation:proton antiporter [Stappia sp. 28M-7]|uniref:cation:proton antiporter n=1 Tax=Stappia sp. 28M-7 TaxID=2762596 RepID=UPI000E72C90E|nr:cation:proton antiporter [Stappia sp. 28M-7]MBC2858769.1 cation:proton antiporter [Stappia sp. 28M-7]